MEETERVRGQTKEGKSDRERTKGRSIDRRIEKKKEREKERNKERKKERKKIGRSSVIWTAVPVTPLMLFISVMLR